MRGKEAQCERHSESAPSLACPAVLTFGADSDQQTHLQPCPHTHPRQDHLHRVTNQSMAVKADEAAEETVMAPRVHWRPTNNLVAVQGLGRTCPATSWTLQHSRRLKGSAATMPGSRRLST